MKRIRLIGGAFALALVTATACMAPRLVQSGPAAAAPNPPNVLDAYVARADPSFAWRVEKPFTGPAITAPRSS